MAKSKPPTNPGSRKVSPTDLELTGSPFKNSPSQSKGKGKETRPEPPTSKTDVSNSNNLVGFSDPFASPSTSLDESESRESVSPTSILSEKSLKGKGKETDRVPETPERSPRRPRKDMRVLVRSSTPVKQSPKSISKRSPKKSPVKSPNKVPKKASRLTRLLDKVFGELNAPEVNTQASRDHIHALTHQVEAAYPILREYVADLDGHDTNQEKLMDEFDHYTDQFDQWRSSIKTKNGQKKLEEELLQSTKGFLDAAQRWEDLKREIQAGRDKFLQLRKSQHDYETEMLVSVTALGSAVRLTTIAKTVKAIIHYNVSIDKKEAFVRSVQGEINRHVGDIIKDGFATLRAEGDGFDPVPQTTIPRQVQLTHRTREIAIMQQQIEEEKEIIVELKDLRASVIWKYDAEVEEKANRLTQEQANTYTTFFTSPDIHRALNQMSWGGRGQNNSRWIPWLSTLQLRDDIPLKHLTLMAFFELCEKQETLFRRDRYGNWMPRRTGFENVVENRPAQQPLLGKLVKPEDFGIITAAFQRSYKQVGPKSEGQRMRSEADLYLLVHRAGIVCDHKSFRQTLDILSQVCVLFMWLDRKKGTLTCINYGWPGK